jgi:hypothetical protein
LAYSEESPANAFPLIRKRLRIFGLRHHQQNACGGTPEEQESGLLHDSLLSYNILATIEQSLLDKVIGSLPNAAMQNINACIMAAREFS